MTISFQTDLVLGVVRNLRVESVSAGILSGIAGSGLADLIRTVVELAVELAGVEVLQELKYGEKVKR